MRTPKGFELHAVYEPDNERMVRALRVLLDYSIEDKQTHERKMANGSSREAVGKASREGNR